MSGRSHAAVILNDIFGMNASRSRWHSNGLQPWAISLPQRRVQGDRVLRNMVERSPTKIPTYSPKRYIPNHAKQDQTVQIIVVGCNFLNVNIGAANSYPQEDSSRALERRLF